MTSRAVPKPAPRRSRNLALELVDDALEHLVDLLVRRLLALAQEFLLGHGLHDAGRLLAAEVLARQRVVGRLTHAHRLDGALAGSAAGDVTPIDLG